MDMATSPVDEHLATLGKDGRLFIYNYLEKKLLLVKRFPAQGSCLLWLPLNVSYPQYGSSQFSVQKRNYRGNFQIVKDVRLNMQLR
jgi:hypothetical protein